MLIFFVLVLSAICAFFAIFHYDAVRTGVVSTMVTFATVICIIVLAVTEEPLPILHDIRTYEIVSLEDGNYSNIEGEITMTRRSGHGYIKTTPSGYLSYYQKEEDRYTLQTIDANRATILYTDDVPKVVIEKQYCEEEYQKWVLWLIPRLRICYADEDRRYTFYIPRDSITQDFDL